MTKPAPYDPARAVTEFRAIQLRIDDPTTKPAEKNRLEKTAQAMRDAWKHWQGEDSLFEMTFGEPFDEKGRPA